MHSGQSHAAPDPRLAPHLVMKLTRGEQESGVSHRDELGQRSPSQVPAEGVKDRCQRAQRLIRAGRAAAQALPRASDGDPHRPGGRTHPPMGSCRISPKRKGSNAGRAQPFDADSRRRRLVRRVFFRRSLNSSSHSDGPPGPHNGPIDAVFGVNSGCFPRALPTTEASITWPALRPVICPGATHAALRRQPW